MEKGVKLGDIIHFSLGKNISRMSVDDKEVYTLDDFDNDLSLKNIQQSVVERERKTDTLILGECVVSLARSQAVVMSTKTAGKYISSNFVRCSFDSDVIDPWFLCYLINEDTDIKGQIKKTQQGTMSCITKMNINSLAELIVVLPSIKRQRGIGAFYKELLKYDRLRKEQSENFKKAVIGIIKYLKED